MKKHTQFLNWVLLECKSCEEAGTIHLYSVPCCPPESRLFWLTVSRAGLEILSVMISLGTGFLFPVAKRHGLLKFTATTSISFLTYHAWHFWFRLFIIGSSAINTAEWGVMLCNVADTTPDHMHSEGHC